jgi:excinuclease ABC subunit C
MMEKTIQLSDSIRNLPETPGVYQFYDSSGAVIYVGKAKNLKKRVSSYFNKNHGQNKTALLVKKIQTIRHIVVDSEQDALLLENNLIKNYQPRYNVLLKDDKTFPWIAISNEPFPRVYSTRTVEKNGTEYFGPYTSVKTIRVLLDLIQQLFKLRTCRLTLNADSIREKKFKVCLQYHIGNCLAPCIGNYSEQEHIQAVSAVKKILAGNIEEVIRFMKQEMKKAADLYQFEIAQNIKEKIDLLQKFQTKSTVVSPTIHNVDVFSLVESESAAFVNYLKVLNGAITQVHTLELRKRLDETPEELIEIAITEMRSRVFSTSKEIILPFKIDYPAQNVKITVPQKGDKKTLLELSERNARFFAMEKRIQKTPEEKVSREARVLDKLKEDLHLKVRPIHIECFDNSNIQGSYPVASCVVFYNGKPAGKEYRHFNIKTVEGPNDFASMAEIVYRRYARMKDEGKSLPQLVIIDGGKGQLSAALESLKKLELDGQIAIMGIAKRLEEIYFPNDAYPLYIAKNSESLRLIQHLRNEAHRFAITFHRQKRSGNFLQTELSSVPGIGEKTIDLLMTYFKSMARIRKQNREQLAQVVGNHKADLLIKHFHSGN